MNSEFKQQIEKKGPAKAVDWFTSGQRLGYDFSKKQIISAFTPNGNPSHLFIWNKVQDTYPDEGSLWLSMMPGFPDGSFGWVHTEELLSRQASGPRLYLDYVGQGDSDKPEDYHYSTIERADLIEALWRYHGVTSTLLVTFDYSSLVALELLSRQIERLDRGEVPDTRIKGFLSVNGGLFADGHTHPFMTTPLLKTAFGKMGARMAQNSSLVFNMMMKDLWSKDYGVTRAELAQVHDAIGRRNGTVFMSNAARFVDEHKSNAERWDLARIFKKLHPEVGFLVAGSEQDQFEHRQVTLAAQRLGSLGLATKKLPGGHMTTSEYPELLVELIQELKSLNTYKNKTYADFSH